MMNRVASAPPETEESACSTILRFEAATKDAEALCRNSGARKFGNSCGCLSRRAKRFWMVDQRREEVRELLRLLVQAREAVLDGGPAAR